MEDCISAMTAVFDGNGVKAEALCDQIMPAYDRAEGVAIGLNTLYLVSCGALVFVMHAGFAMVGHVNARKSGDRIAQARVTCSGASLMEPSLPLTAALRRRDSLEEHKCVYEGASCWPAIAGLWFREGRPAASHDLESIVLTLDLQRRYLFAVNILLQTVMDAAVSAIAFYILGYARGPVPSLLCSRGHGSRIACSCQWARQLC